MNRIVCSCLISLLLLAAPPSSTGAQPTVAATSPPANLHRWGSVTLFHGLPSDHVRAITQDGRGILWFGTDRGLARYKRGRTEKVAARPLDSVRVLTLAIDIEGNLWVGTENGGGLFDGEEFIDAGVGDSAVTAIIPAPRGVFMATSSGAVIQCWASPDRRVSVTTVTPSGNSLLNTGNDHSTPLNLTSLSSVGESLLMGTAGRGLLRLSRGRVEEILSRPRPFFIRAVAVDPEGTVWFGAQTSADHSGLFEASDLQRPVGTTVDTGTVTALAFDTTGNIWLGTSARGVFRLRGSRKEDRFTFENTAGGLRSNLIYSVFVDREGVVWFGTDKGISRYDPQSVFAESISSDPESNFGRALYRATDGTLWCGTNRGLFYRDRFGPGWHRVEQLKERVVHAILEGDSGDLLVGTSGGLYRETAASYGPFPRRNPKFVQIEPTPSDSADSVRAICRFRGTIYVASFGRSVERLESGRRTVIWPEPDAEPAARDPISLYSDGDRELWIGTAGGGAFVFDGKAVSRAIGLTMLEDSSVRGFAGSTDDLLWLATSEGLYGYWQQSAQRILEGVDICSVFSINTVDESRSAWCASAGAGLYRVTFNGREGATLSRLNSERGLPSDNAFAVIGEQDGAGKEVLWIATSHGLARYQPESLRPTVSWKQVVGDHVFHPQEIRDGFSLHYPQNGLVIELAAASTRTFPEQFQYGFEVSDDDGYAVMRRISSDAQLVIQDLKPGRYQVEGWALTVDLVSSTPLLMDFSVSGSPFPWTTTALSILLALAAGALLWGYRQNLQMSRANEALGDANTQLARARIDLANETETERRRIARDLHDQTLADLRRLMMMTDHLPSAQEIAGNGSVEPAAFRREIEAVSTEIRRICEDLSPSALANVGLGAALEWALSEELAHTPVDQRFKYDFICRNDTDQLEPAVQIQICRIAQEALSNIRRHSSARMVRLELAVEPAGGFWLRIEDDGCGFGSNPTVTARGIGNIRSRASLIEAEVTWTGRPGGGTVFTLRKSRYRTCDSAVNPDLAPPDGNS